MHDKQIDRERTLSSENEARDTLQYRSLLAHWLLCALRHSPNQAPTDHAPLAPLKDGELALSFAGHATLLFRYADITILCDPILGNWRGAVRREQPAKISPQELESVDLVLISNQRPDHLDPRTLRTLPRSATIVVPPFAAPLVSPLGFSRLIEVGADQTLVHKGIEIRTVAMKPSDRKRPIHGYVINGNGPSVFFCGRSGYYDGFRVIGETFTPDISVLPIGGYSPSSFRTNNMSPLDALYAFEDLKSKVMIPIRYGSFSLSYEKLTEPARWLGELVTAGNLENYVISLEPGEPRVFMRQAS